MAAPPVLCHLVLHAVLRVVRHHVLRLLRLRQRVFDVLHVARRLRLLPHQLRLHDGREHAGDRQRLLRGIDVIAVGHPDRRDAGAHARTAGLDGSPLTADPYAAGGPRPRRHRDRSAPRGDRSARGRRRAADSPHRLGEGGRSRTMHRSRARRPNDADMLRRPRGDITKGSIP